MIVLKKFPDIEIPQKAYFLLNKKARYKCLYGGRSSGKSMSIAIALIGISLQKKIKVLCTRQLQTSIQDSVHALLKEIIENNKLDQFFDITRDSIRSKNGSEFIFRGLKNNVAEIKSLQGCNICWCEEAESIDKESWDLLIPTIREEDSEIWISFNPNKKSDETYQRFVVNPPNDCISVELNYTDNKFTPKVILKEIEELKETNFARYQHIYLGIPNSESGNLIKMSDFGRYEIAPNQFEQVFISCDTAFSEKKKADYSVFCLCGIMNNSVYIVDVYCKQVNFPDLRRDLRNFYSKWKSVYPNLYNVYIEAKGSGISLIQQLREDNLPVSEIYPTVKNIELKKDVVADKYTRFLEVESDLKSGRIIIPNYSKWLNDFEFQCENFEGGKQETHDDIVDACIIYPLKIYRRYSEVDWSKTLNEFY